MDRRLTPNSGRVAHISLAGQVQDLPLTEGELAQVTASLSYLYASPNGKIDRQTLFGDQVLIIDRQGDHAFVQAKKDGYCGWIAQSDLSQPTAATHRVSSVKTHQYSAPKVQAIPAKPLYLNSTVQVISVENNWAQTPDGFIPASHLSALEKPLPTDPVQQAELFLNTPYYWAGNSIDGIDCSGLVQVSLHACGRACPGDSDLQEVLGQEIPADQPLQRGDLLFWRGHVAWVSDPQTILHANGHSMNVCYEPLDAALTRITTPVTARRRLTA